MEMRNWQQKTKENQMIGRTENKRKKIEGRRGSNGEKFKQNCHMSPTLHFHDNSFLTKSYQINWNSDFASDQ